MDPDRSVYAQVMGSTFARLDANVARFHRLRGHHWLRGQCSIEGAKHPITRIIATIMRLPATQTATPFHFELDANAEREIWTRHFPRRRMRSHLSVSPDGLLIEQLGPVRLQFRLLVENGKLSMHLQGIRVFGLVWPRCWFPDVWARESGDGARFCFDVGARFPRLGLLAAYRGELELPAEDSAR